MGNTCLDYVTIRDHSPNIGGYDGLYCLDGQWQTCDHFEKYYDANINVANNKHLYHYD